MARYRLVIAKILPDFQTEKELKDTLTEQGFTVPKIEFKPVPNSPRPTTPLEPVTEASRIEWGMYANAQRLVKLQNAVIQAKYRMDMAYLTTQLESKFVIATYVVIGHNPNGTKEWGYRIVANPAYKFSQAATRLTSLTTNAIDFICFKYFG